MRNAMSLTRINGDVADCQSRLREAMFNGLSEKDVTEIVQKLVERAKTGDERSIKLVFEYLLGGSGPKAISNSNVVIADVPARRPTRARPGTPAKLSVLSRRAANGESLHHDEDASLNELEWSGR